jgi:long-chain acyl-CoA synthetase
VEVSEDDLAVLAYTSGTTSEPKGVMLTHGNLAANLHQQMSIPDAHVTREDIVFLSLPLFHIFGLNVTLGLVIMNGATGILVERFEPIAALRTIQKHRVTVLFGAPTMYSAWVNTPGADQYDLSSVRLAVSGAAPLSEDTLRSFEQIFGVKIYEGYGLTETAPTLTSNRMGDEPRPRSIGKPLPGVELRVVDDDGRDVELGDPGEIVVRGPNVFAGYWRRDEETKRAFVDGWFRTGDVAVQDEDGYLYIVDRKRDLVIVSGFNVFPSEVEDALLQNPKVKEAAVVGVPHPYTGEAVKAYVVLADGVVASESELIAEVESRLARFKSPQSIEIVDSLPHLLTGKVLRRALRT